MLLQDHLGTQSQFRGRWSQDHMLRHPESLLAAHRSRRDYRHQIQALDR